MICRRLWYPSTNLWRDIEWDYLDDFKLFLTQVWFAELKTLSKPEVFGEVTERDEIDKISEIIDLPVVKLILSTEERETLEASDSIFFLVFNNSAILGKNLVAER